MSAAAGSAARPGPGATGAAGPRPGAAAGGGTRPRGPEPGTEVPALVRQISAAAMVAYAGATWDWHRMHYDAEYTAARGLPGPVVDGQLFGALLTQQLQDWLGPAWRPAALSFRFRNLVFAGQTVRCEGTVTAASPDQVECDLRVVVIGAGGTPTRTAVEPAHAVMVRRA